MSWLTEATARTFAQGRAASTAFAESELRKLATVDISQQFDVFLSHSVLDAQLIVGIKAILEEVEELTVYVDWQNDPQLNRRTVSSETADVLRTRMRNCKSLIYVATNNSSTSKWMPWELGYFDGFRPDHIAILPLMKTSNDSFNDQEYLGLYPALEIIKFNLGGDHLGIRTAPTAGRRVHTFATQS